MKRRNHKTVHNVPGHKKNEELSKGCKAFKLLFLGKANKIGEGLVWDSSSFRDAGVDASFRSSVCGDRAEFGREPTKRNCSHFKGLKIYRETCI